MFEIFTLYYKHRPFVSIANRTYDYTVNPNLLSTRRHPELIALAVVCYNKATKDIALFEQEFYTGTYKIFETLNDAKNWSAQFLEEYLKKAGL